MNRALLAALIAAVAGVIAFIFVEISAVDGPRVGLQRAEACSAAAPDCLPELDMVDTAGKVWTRAELDGQIVVINFWATWCAPCKAEIPDLARFHSDHPDVVLLGLLTDSASDAFLEEFSRSTGLNYPVVRVDDTLAASFLYPEALPTTFVYDRSGALVLQRPGAISQAMLNRELADLL